MSTDKGCGAKKTNGAKSHDTHDTEDHRQAETSQKDIAILTVRSTVAVAGIAALFGAYLGIIESVRMGAFVFLYGIANLVIGFYFGRTNHQRVGGPGGDKAGSR